MKRLFYCTDEHHPYLIRAVHDYENPKKETPLIKFLKDFQPQIVVQGGDQLDLSVIAHWNRGKPRVNENKRLSADYTTYNAVLDQREKVLKSLEKHYMLEGNHEFWIQNLLDELPAFEGMLEVQKNLNLKSRGIQWIEARKHLTIGHLNFIHGDYKDGYLPVYAAKAIAAIYGKSVVYGHQHYNQVYSAQTPFDKRPYQVWGVGCMCNLNPAWKRNSPAAWLNSFGVGYIHDNGNFDFQVINITDNQFVFDGEIYK